MSFTCVGFLGIVMHCITPSEAKPAVVDTLTHARIVQLPADWKSECLDEATGGLDRALRARDPIKWQACANIAGNNRIIKRRRGEILAAAPPAKAKKAQPPAAAQSPAATLADFSKPLVKKQNFGPRTP